MHHHAAASALSRSHLHVLAEPPTTHPLQALQVGLQTELEPGPKHAGKGQEKLLPLKSHALPSVVAYRSQRLSGTWPVN